MTIVYRKQKNAPLTWDDLDGNFRAVQEYTNQAQAAAQTAAEEAAQNVEAALNEQVTLAQSAAADASNAAQARVDNHVAQPDPHMQYVLESTQGQPNGPALLDNNSKIPEINLPSTALNSTLADTLASTYGAQTIGTQSGETQEQVNSRIRKTCPPNVYVASTGSDSNPGSSSSPFLTIQAAVNYIYARQSTVDVTINVGAGTFAGASISGRLPYNINIIISGNGTSSTIVNGSVISTDSASVILDKINFQGSTTIPVWARKKGRIQFKGVSFGATTATSHILAELGGFIQGGGVPYAVTGAAANFHYWTRGSGTTLDVQNTTCNITNTPVFQFFVYFSEASTVYANGWSFTGSTTGGRYVVTTNAVCTAGTTTAAARDTFWPGDHGNTDTSTVDQPNVGGRFDSYPDYGFSTLQTISAAGLSTVEFTKIPDCFTQILIQWTGVNVSAVGANFLMQFKPAGQTAYQTSASFYQLLDFSGTTPARPTAASALNTAAKISGGADCYGCICFNGFHGGAFPLITGNYTDNANVFHTVQGIFLDPNWLRNIRIITSTGTFTTGTFKLLAVY